MSYRTLHEMFELLNLRKTRCETSENRKQVKFNKITDKITLKSLMLCLVFIVLVRPRNDVTDMAGQ